MKRIITLIISVAISIGALTACATGDDNNMNEQPEDVNYEPTQFNDGDNNNRGPDIDTDPRDRKQPNEADTPNNMDEEEPDPDEEPSEERRGH
ncbi:hypothetical protein SAMN04487943_101415 [Gracilibacillus orientalis]|uniref:Uncharacterized protein n=1 Tax=Gracilibacillus orientalis TaxID=334253 RepID=A0A1I4HH76_9BACI|nr:hypothetical protein [Gracilibacillus orientalis]SFL41100.1 hypothetical protein SAMN04487943_101415 [Gracilibacillus orientalis]